MKRILLGTFLLFGLFGAAHVAMAAAGDVVLTTTDELGASLASTTLKFACMGGTVGSAVDGGANDADGTANGTIRASAAFAQGGPDCDDGESFTTKTVEKDGYVTATASLTSYASSTENSAAASLQYGAKVTVLTADNVAFHSAEVTAGKGSKIVCTESSGSTGVYYCPIPISDKNNKVIKVDRDFFISTNDQFPSGRGANTDSQVTATIIGVRYKAMVGIGVAETESTNYRKRVSWTPTTDTNFGKYEIYGRRTEPGVTYLNGSWLATVVASTTGNAVVSASGCGETNYFVVYAIDRDGNRSMISSEVAISAIGDCAAPAPVPVLEVETVVAAEEAVPEVTAEITKEPVEAAEAETQSETVPSEAQVATEEATSVEAPVAAVSVPPATEAETVTEERGSSEEPPTPPSPPSAPEQVTPGSQTPPGLLRVIPNTAAQIQTNVQAVYELVKQRIAQGVNLKESFRDNVGILTEMLRSLFGRK